jgi:hypothetical protein
MEIQSGDRFTDEEGEWLILSRDIRSTTWGHERWPLVEPGLQ